MHAMTNENVCMPWSFINILDFFYVLEYFMEASCNRLPLARGSNARLSSKLGPRQASLAWSNWLLGYLIPHQWDSPQLSWPHINGIVLSFGSWFPIIGHPTNSGHLTPESRGDPTSCMFNYVSTYLVSDQWDSTHLLNILWWGNISYYHLTFIQSLSPSYNHHVMPNLHQFYH